MPPYLGNSLGNSVLAPDTHSSVRAGQAQILQYDSLSPHPVKLRICGLLRVYSLGIMYPILNVLFMGAHLAQGKSERESRSECLH